MMCKKHHVQERRERFALFLFQECRQSPIVLAGCRPCVGTPDFSACARGIQPFQFTTSLALPFTILWTNGILPQSNCVRHAIQWGAKIRDVSSWKTSFRQNKFSYSTLLNPISLHCSTRGL